MDGVDYFAVIIRELDRPSEFVLGRCFLQRRTLKILVDVVYSVCPLILGKRLGLLGNERTVMVHHYLMSPGVQYQGGPVFSFPKSACLMSAFPCRSSLWFPSTLLSCLSYAIKPFSISNPTLRESPGAHCNTDMIPRGNQVSRWIFLHLI